MKHILACIEWMISGAVTLLALFAWTQNTPSATLYDVFPLLGLIAFGLMWTHFIFGAIRRYLGIPHAQTLYLHISTSVVLVLIILHPGLLWYALYRDGLGLPPLSTLTVYSAQTGAILLGSFGLSVFLLYELKRRYENAKWWYFIEKIQIFGMLAIFIHALQLGNATQLEWYRAVWWFYGVTLFISTMYSWWHNKVHKKES